MKPIYVVVNSTKKADFEKKYQLPYGYASSPIFEDFEDAVSYVKTLSKVFLNYNSQHGKEVIVIEKHSSGFSEIVYRTNRWSFKDVQ